MIYVFLLLFIASVVGLSLAATNSIFFERLLGRSWPRKVVLAVLISLSIAFLLGFLACINERLGQSSVEIKSTTTTILTRETTTTQKR